MQAYPEECCGVLMGNKDGSSSIVHDVFAQKNAREGNRTHRFLITVEDYTLAEEEARKEGVEIIGFYHSHPDHPSRPSEFDLEHALPWWSYIIVSVDNGQPGTVNSWIMNEDRSRFEEEEVLVEDGQLKHQLH